MELDSDQWGDVIGLATALTSRTPNPRVDRLDPGEQKAPPLEILDVREQ